MSAVLRPSWLWFSSKRGVPVKPKYCALLKCWRTMRCISPNWLRWHSSMMNTTLSVLYWSNASALFWIALDIFWIVVTISGKLLSFNCLTSCAVLFVLSTAPLENLLNSSSVWLSKSLRSTRKMTFLMSSCSDNTWLALKEVNVLPLPVVCQI